MLLCTTSPSSSLRSMPPPLVGEALAFRHVFQQTQISFIENKTSLPRALLPGELSSGCETERLDKGRLSRERNNAGAALYNLSDIFASLDATSPSRGGFGIPQRFREIPETDKIPETPANSTGTVILIYPTRVCFARVSRHKFVTFCWWSAQTFGGICWAISTRNG